MEPTPYEQEALLAIASGDEAALAFIYRRYSVELRHYLQRFASVNASADDLVQETFVRVMRYRSSLEPNGSLRGWLFRVARKVGLGALQARPMVALEDVALTAPDDPEREFRLREALSALHQAMQRLTPEDRELLRTAKLQGTGYAEIAHRLGTTEGAVKVRVFRALQRLKQQLRESGNEGGWLDA